SLNSKVELEKRNKDLEEKLAQLGIEDDGGPEYQFNSHSMGQINNNNNDPHQHQDNNSRKGLPRQGCLVEETGEEENDPLKTNRFTPDQATEFTYILIKNFEAKKI